MTPVLPFLVAGLIAAVLSFVELNSRLRFKPRLSAAHLWFLRIAVDGIVGGIAAVVAVSLAKDSADWKWASDVGGWVLAGVGGPAILRSRVVTIGKGEAAKEIGPAMVYEPIRDYFEAELDDAGAIEQSQWLNQTVFPRLVSKNVTSAIVSGWYADYLNTLSRMTDAQRAAELAFIDKVVSDTSPDEKKVRVLVSRVVSVGGRGLIERMLRALP